MADLYTQLQGTAGSLFKKFKQGTIEIGVIGAATGPSFDPQKPAPVWTELDAAARGIQYKYVVAGLGMASDTQINTAGLLPGGILPDNTMKIRIDGVRILNIVQVIKKPDAGTTVAYSLIARKG